MRKGEELTFSYYAPDNDSENEPDLENDADETQSKRDKKVSSGSFECIGWS